MNSTDPIADMLTRIRNASLARHRELTLPSSRIKRDIARILAEEGFIESYATSQDGVQEHLTIQGQAKLAAAEWAAMAGFVDRR